MFNRHKLAAWDSPLHSLLSLKDLSSNSIIFYSSIIVIAAAAAANAVFRGRKIDSETFHSGLGTPCASFKCRSRLKDSPPTQLTITLEKKTGGLLFIASVSENKNDDLPANCFLI
ncbi:hypothetical protein ElyMa_003797100 [Elysia marginata]|uniref:Uncharacterized protein n=1 Tax=Elysia marginata TaxID=1093978 RepID=A0AAV4FDT3_9GAST|nr:hypothetical protein ElyMa_003797100 [Elysia marginata]